MHRQRRPLGARESAPCGSKRGSNTTERTLPGSRSAWKTDGGGPRGRVAPAQQWDGSAGRRGRPDGRRRACQRAGDRLHVRRRLRNAELERALDALLPPDVTIRRVRRAPTASTPAMRRDTGNRYTVWNGPRSPLRERSALGVRVRSIPPRWRGPGRSSKAGTTSAPSGRRTARRSGPSAVRVRRNGRTVTIDVRADAFLRGMVRRMVAVLAGVGKGRMNEDAVRAALAGSEPALFGAAAPAKGLTLRRVEYAADRAANERRTGRTMSAKTYAAREAEIERRWFVVDATDATRSAGWRRASRTFSRASTSPPTANLDSGDHVIVLNASRIAVTSGKRETKLYIRHSGYPGPQAGDPRASPRAPAGGSHPPRGEGDAAARPARRPADPQAEDLRRRRPSASAQRPEPLAPEEPVDNDHPCIPLRNRPPQDGHRASASCRAKARSW